MKDPCSSTGTTEITFVTDTSGINDHSFHESTWEDIEKFCAYNPSIGATYIESIDSSELESNLEIAAKQSEVIVASGYNFATAMGAVAPKYPETNFILIDSEPIDENGEVLTLDNVMSYYFAVEQAGYLVGYIAGETTKTNHIGFIGGEPIPSVNEFAYGYVQSAQTSNPEIIIDVEYANSFTDEDKGKAITDEMYGNGCDIIFSAASQTGIGAINSAVEKNIAGEDVWAIGVDSNQYADGMYTAADGSVQSVVLTSAVKHVGNAAYNGLAHHFNGSWDGGSVTTLTVEEGGVGIPEENPNVDPIYIEEATESLLDNVADTLEGTINNITTATINGELK